MNAVRRRQRALLAGVDEETARQYRRAERQHAQAVQARERRGIRHAHGDAESGRHHGQGGRHVGDFVGRFQRYGHAHDTLPELRLVRNVRKRTVEVVNHLAE
jgi:hypothetical protein